MTNFKFLSSSQVTRALTSFYADFRVRCGAVPYLRDDSDSPPEYLLQAIWQHQRLKREQLRTLDGKPVRVLHPGFCSREGGPDFRDAMVQIGDSSPLSGDIEVDLRSSGWHAHGHDTNPAFRKVVLHVVWEAERQADNGPPILPLSGSLDASLGELSLWLGSEAAQDWPAELRGKCCAPFRELTEPQLLELLRQAAEVRLRSKAARFQARARQAGWEQALWEGLFSALGYKHNTWPMQRLAELRPRWMANPTDAFALQARLFGLSGLLPSELTRSQPGADQYLRQVWDQWWRERDEFFDCALPRQLWRFHGLRPANHPQRRLALASHWSVTGNLAASLERWCEQEIPAKELAGSLFQVLNVSSDEFWSWHWTFRSGRLRRAQPMIGLGRVTDLTINVVLPWLWVRATEGKSESMRRKLEERYFAWPPAEDNSVLRLARRRLLGTSAAKLFKSASAQQGLMQIVRDFCEHSDSICQSCKLPELVKEFRGHGIKVVQNQSPQ